MNDEPRYSASELFDLAIEFSHDTRHRQRMYERNLSPCLHAMPVLGQFISFLKMRRFEEESQESQHEWDQFVASVNDRTAQRAVPVCARCGTESPTGQIRLDNLLQWVCPDCLVAEERQGVFGEPTKGDFFRE